MSHSIVEARPPLAGVRYAVFSGLCATLVGIGLARFAYTPLIPALIAAGWFSPGQAVTIGAANLAGYLAGALLGRRMAARSGAAFVLRTNMALAAAAFFACAVPLSFAWFFLWRFASGFAGGVLMVVEIGGEAAEPRVGADQLRVRRDVHAGDLVLGHEALHPLDLGAELPQHFARPLRDGVELGRGERGGVRDLALDDELRHWISPGE